MLKNGLYSITAGVVRAGLTFVSIPILIQSMGLEEYGVWTLVSSVLGFTVLVEAGLPVSATVFVSQDLAREDKNSLSETLTVVIGTMFILATVAALLIYLNAELLISFFSKLEVLQKLTFVQAVQVGSLAVWAQLLIQVFIGIEQAYQEYKLMSLFNSLQWVFCISGWVIIAHLGGQSVALAQWQALASIVSLVCHIILVKRLTKGTGFKLIWNKHRVIEISNYSLVSWISTLGRAFFTKGDRLIVGSLLNSSKLAIYATIFDISTAITLFSSLIVQPLIPTISHLATTSNADKKLLRDKVEQAVYMNAYVAIFIGIFLLITSPLIINSIIIDTDKVKYILAFQLAVIIYTFLSLNATGYWILFSVKGVKKSAACQLFSGLLSLILIAFGATKFDLLGAITGNIGYLGTLILPFVAVKYLDIPSSILISWLKLPVLIFFAVTLVVTYFSIHSYINSYN